MHAKENVPVKMFPEFFVLFFLYPPFGAIFTFLLFPYPLYCFSSFFPRDVLGGSVEIIQNGRDLLTMSLERYKSL
jgi:hypothetical protein